MTLGANVVFFWVVGPVGALGVNEIFFSFGLGVGPVGALGFNVSNSVGRVGGVVEKHVVCSAFGELIGTHVAFLSDSGNFCGINARVGRVLKCARAQRMR